MSEKTQPGIEDPAAPLRLWPGVVAVAFLWLARYAVPALFPEAMLYGLAGGLLSALGVFVWWAFFSRAQGVERWGAIALMVVALAATPLLLHESLATAGMGIIFFAYAVPTLCLTFVAWAVARQYIPTGLRRPTMIAAIIVGCGGWTTVQTYGFTGDGRNEFAWRWQDTPEEQLLAREEAPTTDPTRTATAAIDAGWPGFRGPGRDGVIRDARIETDWSAAPPLELWRRAVGPGWSSFAVRGDLLYTQEQRGEDEIVACYDLATGAPVWQHRDAARFWEANAGAGPRGTPTLHGQRAYTFGATGLLNALDAISGAVAWSRDVAADTGVEVPYWGFSSSPLVIGDAVIVAAAGQLAAYDLATGAPRWHGAAGGDGYSSPHLATIDGTAQVLLLSAAGATAVDPADGALLWEHAWPGYPIVQPAQTADGDVLITANESSGVRRLHIARGADGWTVTERWTSIRLKPYFNDFVVHGDHAFGFDGSILACIDTESGQRQWKGGRYGNGQLILLADQNLLLVISEEGELALVSATPDKFTELARFPAIEGKTWNHPVLVDDVLLVRNDREMAAFRLAPAGS